MTRYKERLLQRRRRQLCIQNLPMPLLPRARMNFRAEQSLSSWLHLQYANKWHRVSAIQFFLVRSGWKDNVIRAIVTDDTRKEQFAGIGPRLVGGKVTIIARQHFRMTPFCRTTIPLII